MTNPWELEGAALDCLDDAQPASGNADVEWAAVHFDSTEPDYSDGALLGVVKALSEHASSVQPTLLASFLLDHQVPALARTLADELRSPVWRNLRHHANRWAPLTDARVGPIRAEFLDHCAHNALAKRASPRAEARWQLVWPTSRGSALQPRDPFTNEIDEASSLEALEEILERLHDHTAHAEARMRRLASTLSKPALADLPDWYVKAAAELEKAPAGVTVGAMRSAARLVRAFAARCNISALAPSLCAGPRGSVEITWSPRLSWTVHPPTVGWPLVNVRAYGHINDRPRSFRLAASVLAFSQSQLA